MANLPIIKITGLNTNPSELSEVPEGSLSECNNIIIDKNSTAEQRRGFKLYGNSMGVSATADIAKQLFVYKDRILRHYSTTLEYDNGSGVFSAFSGSFAETSSGIKLRGLERNGNFYFTSSTGIKKISALTASDFTTSSGFITDAGGIKALDMDLTLNPQTGFFTDNSKVAYRIVWGIKDKNNNVILGFPSQRTIIENSLALSLVKDFNNLLAKIDTQAADSLLDELSDTDYVSSLKIPASVGASASTLRTNLIALATKLENDINTIAASAFTRMTVSGQLTSNVATINLSSPIPVWLALGDQITVSGFSAPLDVFNGVRTITALGASSIDFDLTNPDIALTPDTAGSVVLYSYTAIPQPSTLSTIPTTSELESLQTYFDTIVTYLQQEPASKINDTTIFNTASSTQSATVNVRFTVPDNVTTSYFYQVYRTAVSRANGAVTLDDIDPGDEMGLVFENNPTSSQLIDKEIIIHDVTPESFRGANLYTNPQSGEGILQGNEAPPLSRDIAEFKNHVFYANTKTKHKLQFSLLGVSNITPGVSTFSISNGVTTNTFNFTSPVEEVTDITTVADVAGSLAGTYFYINSAEDSTEYYVWYKVSGSGSDPLISGKTGILVEISTGDAASVVASATSTKLEQLNDFSVGVLANVITVTNINPGITTDATQETSGFTILVTTQGDGEETATQQVLKSDAETPAQQVDETARSLVKIINKQASGLVYAQYLSGPTDVPGLLLLESRTITGPQFYIYEDDATTTGLSFSPNLPDNTVVGYTTQVVSDNEVATNRIYYSKFQQPEAVPIVNYFDAGARDDAVLRILALRDSLFVLKESGVYRISGEGSISGFNLALFDNTTSLVGHDTAVVLNNQVFMLSDQGVATISDTGISVISRPIENILNPIPLHTNFLSASFGVAYESDRAYLLWTTSDNLDVKATQCFRYNLFTQTWTRWETDKTCGIIKDNVLYLGTANTNFIEIERKSYTRIDHADREYVKTIILNSVDGKIINMPSLANISVGDVLTQQQYLTLYRYNQLLEKLDMDNGVADTDYFSTLEGLPGVNLRNKLDDLAAKLDADVGITTTTFASSISAFTTSFPDTQSAYNVIVNLLNADVGAQFVNYVLSVGTILFESIIESIDTRFIKLTLQYELPIIEGEITTYAHIPIKMTWNVQTFQDPEQFKHVSEGKLIFHNTAFSNATVSYSSDVSPAFESIKFYKQSNGIFGSTEDETDNFGGNADKTPFRTLIPRNKQRCRYIIVKVSHSIARETIGILGYSLVFQPYSVRAYRN